VQIHEVTNREECQEPRYLFCNYRHSKKSSRAPCINMCHKMLCALARCCLLTIRNRRVLCCNPCQSADSRAKNSDHLYFYIPMHDIIGMQIFNSLKSLKKILEGLNLIKGLHRVLIGEQSTSFDIIHNHIDIAMLNKMIP
jgi:hypothetical protein